jgi:multicomponent Na+:H+ antiporter subunit F
VISPLVLSVFVLTVLAAVGLGSVRILRGPRHADRIVALDVFLAGAVALCVAASLASGRTVYLDVAIGLALVGFVGTLAWARLLDRSSGASDPRREKP